MKKSSHNPMLHIRGTVPGPHRAMKLHHAMASGAEMPSTPREVHTFQKEGETGWSYAPGMSHKGAKAHNRKKGER